MSGSNKLDAFRLGLAAALACLALGLIASLLFGFTGGGMFGADWMMSGTPGSAFRPHMGFGGVIGISIFWAIGCGLFFWLLGLIYNRLIS